MEVLSAPNRKRRRDWIITRLMNEGLEEFTPDMDSQNRNSTNSSPNVSPLPVLYNPNSFPSYVAPNSENFLELWRAQANTQEDSQNALSKFDSIVEKVLRDEPSTRFVQGNWTPESLVCPICTSESQNSYFPLIGSKSMHQAHHPAPIADPIPTFGYLDNRINLHNNIPKSSFRELDITIDAQPASYQISNYNVYPPPKIFFNQELIKDEELKVSLVESTSDFKIKQGFQTGNTRALKSGGNCLVLSGLKLSKMRQIKTELRQNNINRWDTFCIRIEIGNKSWDTFPFKLISNCNQLPLEIKEAVRPAKKQNVASPTRNGETPSASGV